MAAGFESSDKRALWAALCFGILTDIAGVAVLVYFLASPQEYLFSVLFALAAIWAFQITYMIWSFGRRLIWFNLFEKKARIEAIKRELVARKFPAPDRYFDDAEQYLNIVAEDLLAPDDARLWSAVTIGAIAAQRLLSRTECMLSLMVLEKAILEYAQESPRSERRIYD